jgi:hypothetical protein
VFTSSLLLVPGGCIHWGFRGRDCSAQMGITRGALFCECRVGRFSQLCVLIGAMRTMDAMRGVWLSKMGMHAFQISGGRIPRLLRRRYCNALNNKFDD